MFVHLRLHSEFSIIDGTNRIETVVELAQKDHQPALAVTDWGNLFGAIKFYKEARAKGVKPIIGTEVILESAGSDSLQNTSKVILLVQNNQGYLNLCELITRAWTQNVHKDLALVKWTWLSELSDGLILL